MYKNSFERPYKRIVSSTHFIFNRNQSIESLSNIYINSKTIQLYLRKLENDRHTNRQADRGWEADWQVIRVGKKIYYVVKW